MTLNDFLDAAERAGLQPKRSGSQYLLRCPHPAHPDANPSATVAEKGGNVVLTCHSACDSSHLSADARQQWWQECLQEIGLWDEATGQERINIRFASHRRVPAPSGRKAFDARDAITGEVVATHHRNDDGRGGKKVWWEPTGIRAESLALFGADTLTDGPVVVVEGERAQFAVKSLGIATVATYGANVTPCDEAVAVLADRDVVLFPDNDEAGRGSMEALAARIAPVAGSVRIVSLGGDYESKWDAADGVAAGEGQHVRDLIDTAVLYSPGKATGRTTGHRTACDLPVGPPPPLLLDWLLPKGTTLLYGTGGTGKGVLSSVFAAMLVRELGYRVLVIDYENHPEEWGSRFSGLVFEDGTTLTDDEKQRIHYRSPYDIEDWTEKTGSLHAVADLIRADCDENRIDFVVVDSYTPATDGEDSLGGQKDAQKFAMGMVRIGRPALVLAHIAANGERLPDKPFGSIHVRNLVARLMYAVAQVNEQEATDTSDRDGLLIAPQVIKVEAKRTKGNQYGKGANRFIEVTFHPGGAITWALDAAMPVPSVKNRIVSVLAGQKPMTAAAIAKAISEDWPEHQVKDNTVRVVLDRYPKTFASVGDTRPKVWKVISNTTDDESSSATDTTLRVGGVVAFDSDGSNATRSSVNATTSATSPSTERNTLRNNEQEVPTTPNATGSATTSASEWSRPCREYDAHRHDHHRVAGKWECPKCPESETYDLGMDAFIN